MKKVKLLKKGRRFVFTLALFLLVFAVASIVKIQAAGKITGWSWGGGAGTSGDGTHTNVGWISMDRSDCDPDLDGVTEGGNVNNPTYPSCPDGLSVTTDTNYGVKIPSGDGDLSGYAWSENIGWISFNSSDLTGCPAGTCSARREGGDYLKGWARILGIKKELEAPTPNSGGWQGWISLSGTNYGVQISKMDGIALGQPGDAGPTYAWSASSDGTGELGWIDFSQAKYEEVCTLEFVPSTKTINENSSETVMLQEVGSVSTCNSGTVSLTPNNSIVSSLSPATVDFSAPAKETKTVTVGVGPVNSDTTYNNAVTASSANSGTANLNLVVQNVPVCTLNCPSEIVVSPGQTVSAKSKIGITGEAGCTSSAISCSESGTDAKGNIDVNSGCDVTETQNLRYGSSELTATGGASSCTAPIYVKGPGWIETNP